MDHDKRLSHIFSVKFVAIVRALIRTVVEHLQKLRATQVEHKLQSREKERDNDCV